MPYVYNPLLVGKLDKYTIVAAGDVDGGAFTDTYINVPIIEGGLFTDTYIDTTNIDGGAFE